MRVDHATGETLAEASASADTEPPQGGLHERSLFKARTNQPLVLQFFLTNRYPHGEKRAVRVRYFIVRESKARQKEVPDWRHGSVTDGCFTLNMKPKARVGARVAFTIKKPGLYLLRVQTENTDSDHEHFSAPRHPREMTSASPTKPNPMKKLSLPNALTFAMLLGLGTASACAAEPWLVFHGDHGPGKGRHIVLISGDEEYRSEEGLPQLAKILAKHHGFKCTVLFAIDPKDGTINPNYTHHIPGLEALEKADLMVILTRFRDLPDSEMKYIVDYVESGRPIIGMRTATHAFARARASTNAIPRTAASGRAALADRCWGNLGQPSRPPRPAEHAGHHRPWNGKPSDPARHP